MIDQSTSQLRPDEDFSDPDYLPASYRGTGMPDELSEAGQRILQCQMEPPESPRAPIPLTIRDAKAILAAERPGEIYAYIEHQIEYSDTMGSGPHHSCKIMRMVGGQTWEADSWEKVLAFVLTHHAGVERASELIARQRQVRDEADKQPA